MTSAGSACPSASAAYSPRPPSITESGPSAPAAASRAARMPACDGAARGGAAWSRSRWPGTPAAPRPSCRRCRARRRSGPRSSRSRRAATSAAAKTPQACGGVQPALVEGVRCGAGDPADGLEAGDGGEQGLLAGGADLLADGEHRGQHDGGRVHQPAGVGVVEVQRVHQGAGRQRGGRGGDPHAAAEQGGLRRPAEPGRDGERRARQPATCRPRRAVPSPSSRCRRAAADHLVGYVVAAQAEGPRGEVGGDRHGTTTSPKAPRSPRSGDRRRRRTRASRRGSGRRPRCAAAPGGTSAARSRPAPATRPGGTVP